MATGIELLEEVYGQLRAAGVVHSKAEFSQVLLGKSSSYLTSMRARQRAVPSEIIMALGDNLMVEIADLNPVHNDTRALLRRAVAQVNTYLADQTIPAKIAMAKPPSDTKAPRRVGRVLDWFRALTGRLSYMVIGQNNIG